MLKIALILGVALILLSLAAYPYLQGDSRLFESVDIPAPAYVLKARQSIAKSIGDTQKNLWMIFVHGNRKSGQAHPLYTHLLDNIDRKISILAIDLRGFGKSPSQQLSNAEHIVDRSEDVDAAVLYLKNNYAVTEEDIVLAGHSLGSITVLKATQGHNYRQTIAIGPSDFSVFLNDSKRMQSYISKFSRNTGAQIDTEKFLIEGAQLTPQALFTPCPVTPISLVFGANDFPDTLINKKDTIPEKCRNSLSWVTIPFSDHMYQAENSSLLRPLLERISIGFLVTELNRIINEP